MREVLERVRDWLEDAELLTGYSVKFFRWTDEELQGAARQILIRPDGTEGPSDPYVQRPRVQLVLIEEPTRVLEGDARMRAVTREARSLTEPGPLDTVEIDAAGPVQGPFYLDNGRAWWRLVLTVTVEDH